MGNIVLGGAIDMHCHFGPESVVGTPHSVDAFDAASLDFAAVVLMCRSAICAQYSTTGRRFSPRIENGRGGISLVPVPLTQGRRPRGPRRADIGEEQPHN